MDLDTAGRAVLVLGAGSGLGSAVAAKLAAENVNVAVADVNAESLVRTAAAVAATGTKVLRF